MMQNVNVNVFLFNIILNVIVTCFIICQIKSISHTYLVKITVKILK